MTRPSAPRHLRCEVRRVPGPPVVAVRAFLPGGARQEEIPGQALVTGRALTEGTRRRDWRQLADQAESLGLSVQSSATFDLHGVSIDGLAEHWEKALDWAAELLAEPTFPLDRHRWTVRQVAAELDSLADQPEVRTAWAFHRLLYTPNPRSRPIQGTPEGLAQLAAELDREERDREHGPGVHGEASAHASERFHRRGLIRGPRVTVAGAIDPDTVEDRVEELFGQPPFGPSSEDCRDADGAEGDEDDADTVPPPTGLEERRWEVPLDPGDQAHLYVGCVTVDRGHEDYLALELLGVVLGAGAGLTGRLPERIREREGLAYSVQVHTTLGAGRDPGRLAVYAGTAPATVEAAERAMTEEIARLVEDGVTDDEVSAARSYLLGREPFRRETARQWADLLGNDLLYGTLERRPEHRRLLLESLSPEHLLEVARRHLAPERLKTAVGLPGSDSRG